jgi:hypothetical protein
MLMGAVKLQVQHGQFKTGVGESIAGAFEWLGHILSLANGDPAMEAAA